MFWYGLLIYCNCCILCCYDQCWCIPVIATTMNLAVTVSGHKNTAAMLKLTLAPNLQPLCDGGSNCNSEVQMSNLKT